VNAHDDNHDLYELNLDNDANEEIVQKYKIQIFIKE
jgi:hypothetical protein